jgi:hypothetical protein
MTISVNKGSGNLTEWPIFKQLEQDEENLTPRRRLKKSRQKMRPAFDTLQHATYIALLTTAFGK